MTVKQLLRPFIPQFVSDFLNKMRDNRRENNFNALPITACKTNNLIARKNITLSAIFNSNEINERWASVQNNINKFAIPDGTGGVNPGDRRALFYLISHFKPQSILEIGTHIGASTLNTASAMAKTAAEDGIKAQLTTLDIRDVNDQLLKPWLEYGTTQSPLEMIQDLDMADSVHFIQGSSVDYLKNTTQKFDFIFLDGDHSAQAVYQEVPLALNLLNPNGVILLHDYYPNGQPLWSNNYLIDGPYRAIERFTAEGADLIVLPLGNLPWATKLNSNATSLALLMKKT